MPNLESFPAASPPRAWAEINLAHLRQNLGVVNSHQQGDVMAVLKAGAYGHGMEGNRWRTRGPAKRHSTYFLWRCQRD